MSKMNLRSSGRPPLGRSPIKLRPRRSALQPANNNTINSPPGSLTKSQMPVRNMDIDKPEIRPEYHSISCELRALTKMVNRELGKGDENAIDDDLFGVPLFERGRFYNEYSARRNERLKRKKDEMDKSGGYDLGVRVESAKKREVRKFDSQRKVSVASTPVAERREACTSRYSLRSSVSKENRKPPMPMAMPMMSVDRSVGVSERKVRARTAWKK